MTTAEDGKETAEDGKKTVERSLVETNHALTAASESIDLVLVQQLERIAPSAAKSAISRKFAEQELTWLNANTFTRIAEMR